jgi:hypothetical protein
VRSINGKIYEIRALPDGKTFFCDQLPITPAYKYTIFDTIVDLLIKNGGTAEKGNGRNYKLGEPHCTANTVVGAVAIAHSGKKEGDSIFDPVFVLASVLDWACIAHNRRGYIELTKEYKAMLM